MNETYNMKAFGISKKSESIKIPSESILKT